MKPTLVSRTGFGSGGVEANGILDSRNLPDKDFSTLWETIVIEDELKDRLLSQAVLNFTLRPKVNRADIPLHGIILLVGPPGTGKTSLARGLASRAAEAISGAGKMLYLEIEPHSLTSSALGKSQKAVTELLGSTIAENAATRPLIVLLDEVETLAADRSKMSLEANPVDVHRATDAVLAQLDQLAARYPQLLFIATSNFPKAIDRAFLSRVDLIVTVDMPSLDACRKILISTIEGLGKAFPAVRGLHTQSDFDRAVKQCYGLDGRSIRKVIPAACTFNKETAMDPNRMTVKDIIRAAEHAQKEAHVSKGDR